MIEQQNKNLTLYNELPENLKGIFSINNWLVACARVEVYNYIKKLVNAKEVTKSDMDNFRLLLNNLKGNNNAILPLISKLEKLDYSRLQASNDPLKLYEKLPESLQKFLLTKSDWTLMISPFDIAPKKRLTIDNKVTKLELDSFFKILESVENKEALNSVESFELEYNKNFETYDNAFDFSALKIFPNIKTVSITYCGNFKVGNYDIPKLDRLDFRGTDINCLSVGWAINTTIANNVKELYIHKDQLVKNEWDYPGDKQYHFTKSCPNKDFNLHFVKETESNGWVKHGASPVNYNNYAINQKNR